MQRGGLLRGSDGVSQGSDGFEDSLDIGVVDLDDSQF